MNDISRWPAPDPGLASALIGAVLHAQGAVERLSTPSPWAGFEIDRYEPVLRAALKGRDLTYEEVRNGVRQGWFVPWHLREAILVTETVLTPRIRALHVIAGGGTLKDLAELTPAVEWVARQAGCNLTGATGRKGWLRWLKPFGYRPADELTLQKAL